MLDAWSRFVRVTDSDIITGYGPSYSYACRMQTCKRKYTHTCIHKYVHTYIYTFIIRICMNASMHIVSPLLLAVRYNIGNFDFPYLIKRAKHLKVKNFTLLGRIKGKYVLL
jgi:hypothetical protein